MERGVNRPVRRPRMVPAISITLVAVDETLAPNLLQSLRERPDGPLRQEGTSITMPDLAPVALLAAAAPATLSAVYLWSNDPARRRRAWNLLKLLLRR